MIPIEVSWEPIVKILSKLRNKLSKSKFYEISFTEFKTHLMILLYDNKQISLNLKICLLKLKRLIKKYELIFLANVLNCIFKI